MAQLNRNGPEDKGSGTGRNLGFCNKNPESKHIGVGMGLRRRVGEGKGEGRRNRSGFNLEN